MFTYLVEYMTNKYEIKYKKETGDSPQEAADKIKKMEGVIDVFAIYGLIHIVEEYQLQ